MPVYSNFGPFYGKICEITLFSANLRTISDQLSAITNSANFQSYMIIFGSGTCNFRSQTHTNWNLFSILLDNNFAHFRSEFENIRTKFNDFPFSAAFLDLSRSISGLKNITIHMPQKWILSPSVKCIFRETRATVF